MIFNEVKLIMYHYVPIVELRRASCLTAGGGCKWLVDIWAEHSPEIVYSPELTRNTSTSQDALNKTLVSPTFHFQNSPNFHRLRGKHSRNYWIFFLPRTSIFPWYLVLEVSVWRCRCTRSSPSPHFVFTLWAAWRHGPGRPARATVLYTAPLYCTVHGASARAGRAGAGPGA